MGVDRQDFPFPGSGRKKPRDAKALKWMETFLALSNMRFSGAYVCGPALTNPAPAKKLKKGQRDERFTVSSVDIDRGWIPNVAALAIQGWGVVFWYLGYSLMHDPRAEALETNRARGTLHGLHLRTSLAVLGNDWAGATVMIDQEDDRGTVFPKFLLDYYHGLFDEMARPDKDLPSFRPGMYCRLADVGQILKDRPDLFLWEVKYDTSQNNTPESPAEAIAAGTRADLRRMIVLPAKRPVSAALVTRGQSPPWIVWPIGRQFRYYTGYVPPPELKLPKQTPPWVAVKAWDFNSALVRNPAFPVAEPRLAAMTRGGGVILLRGSFRPATSATAKGTASPPLMEIEQITRPANTTLGHAAGKAAAPETPLLLLGRPKELLAVTVLGDSKLGVASRDAKNKWGALDAIPGAQVDVRRLHALAGVTFGADDVQVFFIGSDQLLHGRRSLNGGAWSAGKPLHEQRVHPFSQLAATARGAHVVEVFFIDPQGLLALVYWPRRASKWPSFTRLALESAPHFLAGTALAAVSPTEREVFAFGVGLDLRLWFVSFVVGQGWSAPAPIGGKKDFVGPHARIAVHAPTADVIEACTLSDGGAAVVYSFGRSRGALVAGRRSVLDGPPPAAKKEGATTSSKSGRVAASGWRLNPFGDLGIVRPPGGQSVLYAAGLKGGEHQILRREVAEGMGWEVFTS